MAFTGDCAGLRDNTTSNWFQISPADSEKEVAANGSAAATRASVMRPPAPPHSLAECFSRAETNTHGGLSKLWSLYGSPKLGPVLGPVL